ncbi:MAG: 2-hydroxychromene-2-carboxylate isomerase [Pseudomonadales bacterium]|nr:2-hydroxychromene-2-carboxylate isomerase [Pseudomonadales bacterium]
MPKLEFFFDCSSPWTYLGFETLQQTITKFPEVQVIYKPILVGGVFNSVNPSVYEGRNNPVPAKLSYSAKDLQRWADHVGVEIGQPPVFPVNSVKAMRGAFVALEGGCLVKYARQVFQSYWRDLKDISQDDVLQGIIQSVGLEQTAFFNKINNPTYKEQLKVTTAELIERGGFGSPTIFVNAHDMYFGNDRFALIDAQLDKLSGT